MTTQFQFKVGDASLFATEAGIGHGLREGLQRRGVDEAFGGFL